LQLVAAELLALGHLTNGGAQVVAVVKLFPHFLL
jgi:hypothetical protein